MAVGLSAKDLPAPIEELLRSHELWLETSGQQGKQLDISKYDLRTGVKFQRARLTMMRAVSSILYGVNLTEAQLQAADLRDADLRNTNLQFADMRGGRIAGAQFNNANLHGVNLQPLVLNQGPRYRRICPE